MSFFDASRPVSKRGLLRFGSTFAAASLLMIPGLAQAAGIIDVTAAPYGASPSKTDNTAAFQAALNTIGGNGGGRLYVPGGNYVLASPLTYSGGSLTILGDGQDNTVLINTHSGTVLTANLGSQSNCLTVKELGFSPCSGGVAQGAISVVIPAGPSGWQNAVIEEVCIGVPYATNGAQYTSYANAILLTNTNRARISNVNVHANNITGGMAVALSGTCYDTRVLGCTLEGYSYGVAVTSYCEGLHLANNVIICGTAVHTGTVNFNTGAFAINLLELLMSDCEINTQMECMYLYQVKNAQITNCHFTGPGNANGGAAIDMRGCTESLISSSTFCNSWGPGGIAMLGILLNPSSRIPTATCHITNVEFENTTVGIYLGAGAQSNTADNVQLLAQGAGALVNGTMVVGGQLQQVYIDASGNTTNNVAWLTSANTASAVVGRRINTQH